MRLTPTNATEFVYSGKTGSLPGPDLPYPVSEHCLAKINSTTVLLIGGNNGQSTAVNTTLFYSTKQPDAGWTYGPSLKNARALHACGSLQDSTLQEYRLVVVASGG